MTEWILGGYDGIEYLGGPSKDDESYRGYVVQVDEYGNWFAYHYNRETDKHEWIAEGSKDAVKSILARVAG
jgi:hypothetical protein